MKKLYMSFIFLTYFVCIGNDSLAQSEFVLKGNIEDNQRQVEKAFLELPLPDKILRDSVAVVNGKYVFKGKLDRGFDIPKNILIDPAGKIIAKDLFGEDLFKKLEAIFKKEAHSK